MRRLALLSVFLALPALAQRGGSSTATPQNLMPDCARTSGRCPAENYFCVDSRIIYRCRAGVWTTVTGAVTGPVAGSADNQLVRFDGITGNIIQAYTQTGPSCGDTGACLFLNALTVGSSIMTSENIVLNRNGESNIRFQVNGTSVSQIRGVSGGGLRVSDAGSNSSWLAWDSAGRATFNAEVASVDSTGSLFTILADGANLGATVGLLITTNDTASVNYTPLEIRDARSGANNRLFYVDYTGKVTASGGFEGGPTATPTMDFKDSDAAAAIDPISGQIAGNLTATGDGTEDMDLGFRVDVAGTLTTLLNLDADAGGSGGPPQVTVTASQLTYAGCANTASATTISVNACNVVTITGSTQIDTINTCNASSIYRPLTILCGTATAQITDGSNLLLAGNFPCTADDSISLLCNGTSWVERGRSAN